MVIAALVAFAILVIGWLVAPSGSGRRQALIAAHHLPSAEERLAHAA